MKRREIGRAVRAYLVQEREVRADARRTAETIPATPPAPRQPPRRTLSFSTAIGARAAVASA